MLVSIMANLMLEGGVIPPPVTRNNVPVIIEDRGGSDGENVSEIAARKLINRDNEDLLLIISKWVIEQN